MTRIVYISFPDGSISGGQKMIFRHVETLRNMGFDAVYWTNRSAQLPSWLENTALIEIETPFHNDDILVLPEDAPNAILSVATLPQRVMVFCQNHYYMAALSFAAIDKLQPGRFLGFIVPGHGVSTPVARAFPQAEVHVIPCFADERLFKPAPAREHAIALIPRKRFLEAKAIRSIFCKIHPRHRDLPWYEIEAMTEKNVAEVMGRCTLFLSLNRLEGPGMTLLEALASGCVAAGFTGIGSREYTNRCNGFWVEEDDCDAAADALAWAADLVRGGALRFTLRSWRRAKPQRAGHLWCSAMRSRRCGCSLHRTQGCYDPPPEEVQPDVWLSSRRMDHDEMTEARVNCEQAALGRRAVSEERAWQTQSGRSDDGTRAGWSPSLIWRLQCL